MVYGLLGRVTIIVYGFPREGNHHGLWFAWRGKHHGLWFALGG